MYAVAFFGATACRLFHLHPYGCVQLPAMRLELIPPCGEGILSPQCLPFHHAGKMLWTGFIIPEFGLIEKCRNFDGSFISTETNRSKYISGGGESRIRLYHYYLPIHHSRTLDFWAFTLNANVIVNLVDYALRTRQVERLIAIFNETEYAILTVKVNEVCRLEIALAHIGVDDFSLQMSHLVKFHSYSSFQRSQSPHCSAWSISKMYSALSR